MVHVTWHGREGVVPIPKCGPSGAHKHGKEKFHTSPYTCVCSSDCDHGRRRDWGGDGAIHRQLVPNDKMENNPECQKDDKCVIILLIFLSLSGGFPRQPCVSAYLAYFTYVLKTSNRHHHQIGPQER